MSSEDYSVWCQVCGKNAVWVTKHTIESNCGEVKVWACKDCIKANMEARTLTITITCSASLELFTQDWDDLSPQQQALFNEDRIPCRESSTLGSWCLKSCPFAIVEEIPDYLW